VEFVLSVIEAAALDDNFRSSFVPPPATASVKPEPLAPLVALKYVLFSALLANALSPNVVEFTRYGTCPFVLLIVVPPAIVTVTVCPARVKLPFGNINVCVPGTFGDPSTSLTLTPFPVG
jgi:hypothetical protein